MTENSTHSIDPEKLNIEHVETNSFGLGVGGFATDEDSLPPGYFKSSFFLGSMTAIGLGLLAGVAGFGYAAPWNHQRGYWTGIVIILSAI
jgi:hypothetical protein